MNKFPDMGNFTLKLLWREITIAHGHMLDILCELLGEAKCSSWAPKSQEFLSIFSDYRWHFYLKYRYVDEENSTESEDIKFMAL